MAAGATIGDLFCITMFNDTSEQAKKTVTPGRSLKVVLIEIILTAVNGGTTVLKFKSSTDGSAGEVDMFGGDVATKINNVNLVAQSTASGMGSLVLAPTAGQILNSSGGTLSIETDGANASYLCRFYCMAENPTTLSVV